MEEEQRRKEAAAAELKARQQRKKQEMQAMIDQYEEPEWAKVDELEEDGQIDEEEQDFFCVVCDRSYKSEKQFVSHEKSKKHLDNLERLREEMLADEANFEFGTTDPVDDLVEQIQEVDLTVENDAIPNKKKKKKNKKKIPNFGYEEDLNFI